MRTLLPTACVLALLATPVTADETRQQSQHHDYTVRTLIDGLEHPWSIAFISATEWLITERPGRLRHVRDGELAAAPVAGVPAVQAVNQGGLLDVVLHPDFATNRLLYLTWSQACEDQDGNTTAMGRGRFEDGTLHDFETLFVADACAPGGRHHGSRLVFDGAGHVFMTIGDRGQQDRAQDPSDHAGTTLRLNEDGSVPADNPFVGDDGKRDEIWTWGNRNAQGMAMHPETGELWQHEHGPRGGDELNLIRPGLNYGWPTITYGEEYRGGSIGVGTHQDGMEQPVKQWTPSIAPSGLAIYSGDAFPAWRGDLLVGALAFQHMARVRLDGNDVVEEERLIENLERRIRDVRVGPDGLIYVLTDEPQGLLLRLEPITD